MKKILFRTTVTIAALVALPAFAGNADFERLLKMEGEWLRIEDGKVGDEVASIWQVTAAGTTILETLAPGTEYEMVTAYHTSGDSKLAMTHYCAGGNQPRMEAEADGGKIEFVHAGGDNVPNENVGHMHALTIEFIDDDHVIAQWSHHADGAEDHAMTFDLVRKK